MTRFLITSAFILTVILNGFCQTAPASEAPKPAASRNFDIPSDLKWPTGAANASANNAKRCRELKAQLPTLKNTNDSIRALYDIYDLSRKSEKLDVALHLYRVAKNAHDYTTQLDVLRQLAQQVKADSSYSKLLKEVNKIPASEQERKETELYILLKREAFRSSKYTKEQNRARLVELIAEDQSDKDPDKYQNVLRLYTICQVLRTVAKGDLMTEYLQKLEQAMKDANFKLYALQKIFLRTSANLYTGAGESKKAVEYDRQLLTILDRLEQAYKARGRNHHHYCEERFKAYRRMLVNYEALSVGEVEKIYDDIIEIANYNEDVYNEANNSPRLAAFYLIAHNRYAEAIPLLEKAIAKEQSLIHKRLLLELLEDAGKKTNNQAVVLRALDQYNDFLVYLDSINSTEKFNELRIRYEVSELQNENNALELENRNNVLFSQRRLLNYIIVGWILIVVLMIGLLIYYTRYRRLSSTQANLLHNLNKERMAIMDAEFKDYDRHLEFAGLTKSKKKKESNHSLKKASDMKSMAEYLINDSLCVASISKKQRNSYIKDTTPAELAYKVEAAAKGHIPSDIKFIIEEDMPDITMHTDVSRVESVLVQLLRMIVKHSRNCRIKLTCTVLPDNVNVKFAFHVDGREINDNEGELKFFDKFLSVEQLAEHDRPGLLIGRLMTLLLHSEVRMRSTPEGRKVSFITPINLL